MKLTINEKEFELNFGIGFLEELDRLAGMKANGVEMGMSLQRILPALSAEDPLALIKVLHCSTHACSPRPSMQMIADMYGALKDKDVEKLFIDLHEELRNSTLTGFTVKKFDKEIKEAQKQAEQQNQ